MKKHPPHTRGLWAALCVVLPALTLKANGVKVSVGQPNRDQHAPDTYPYHAYRRQAAEEEQAFQKDWGLDLSEKKAQEPRGDTDEEDSKEHSEMPPSHPYTQEAGWGYGPDATIPPERPSEAFRRRRLPDPTTGKKPRRFHF